MMLTIQIPPDTEARLAEKARLAGVDTPTYAASVLQAAVARPPLDQMLEPVRRKFAKAE